MFTRTDKFNAAVLSILSEHGEMKGPDLRHAVENHLKAPCPPSSFYKRMGWLREAGTVTRRMKSESAHPMALPTTYFKAADKNTGGSAFEPAPV